MAALNPALELPRFGWRQHAQAGARHNASRAGASGVPAATPRVADLSADFDDFERQLKPLWLRAQAGDEPAYREALRRIAVRLRSYLRRRMQTLPDDLEDLVQETLLALHLQRGTYDPELPVSAWVLAIARHKLVDLWRRRGRQDALHDPIDDVDEGLLQHSSEDLGASRDLGILLANLPLAQRNAIVLTKLEGLSVAEASARTGASESAIKVQVHRGLKKLAALVQGA